MRKYFATMMMLSSACMLNPSIAHAEQDKQMVLIRFALESNHQAVKCGDKLSGLGQAHTDAILRDARFYVQDPVLIGADGEETALLLDENEWQNNRLALLDFSDDASSCNGAGYGQNHVLTGTAPTNIDYTGFKFTVGVPETMNHTSTELEAAPLDLADMGWSWQAGRKFIKIEVDPAGGVHRDDESTAKTWFVHLGSTGCTGNPLSAQQVFCQFPNRIPVRLETFDPEKTQIILNLNALFEGSDLSQDRGGASGCMGNIDDPECKNIYKHLGLHFSGGLPDGNTQSDVFSVRPLP